jgi:hypothetical protein
VKDHFARPLVLIQPPLPAIAAVQRARLQCGCAVYIGRRVDNHQAATGAIACGDEHRELINRFNVALLDSLEHADDTPLLDVCDRLLLQAAAA